MSLSGTVREAALPMLLLACGAHATDACAQVVGERAALVAALDSAARAHAGHELVAGVSVGVVRGSDTLLLAGRDTLVRLIEAEPFEFEPGTALIYNNSAYFLLGLLIEEVSGQPYEEYVEEHLFGPVGMPDSYYCSERAVRHRRAHGYDAGSDGLRRKAYLDHTWPYAAGSLCSTAGDLVRWNQALHGGEVLSPASYADMVTPDPLADGTTVRYGMGLGISERRGRRLIAHGGGINGFLTDGRYYPDEGLIVVVLQNSAGPVGPGALGQALAELVLGPAPDAVATPYGGDLAALAGEYVGPARGREMTPAVGVDDGRMSLEVNGGDPFEPEHRDGLTWARGGTLITFVRRNGRVHEVRYDTGTGHYVLTRSD